MNKNNFIINSQQLSFKYADKLILDKIELNVPRYSIYGYLGKNGAGKSTTIKLLLGLLPDSNDTIYIDNSSLKKNRVQVLSKTGNLIESPCFYSYMTVWQNLEYLDRIYKLGRKRIDEILLLVNLTEQKNKKTSRLSTGMKQRLGIAMAIFNNPEILILDEPMNGLDPQGIYDLRVLLTKINSQGTTIFLSSHILSELEKIATHIGIIDKGQLIFQGEKSELLSKVVKTVIFRVNDLDRAIDICQTEHIECTRTAGDYLAVDIKNDIDFNDIISLLINNSIEIYSTETLSSDLENIFLTLTSEN